MDFNCCCVLFLHQQYIQLFLEFKDYVFLTPVSCFSIFYIQRTPDNEYNSWTLNSHVFGNVDSLKEFCSYYRHFWTDCYCYGSISITQINYRQFTEVIYFYLFGLWGYCHCGHSWPIMPASDDIEDDCGEADHKILNDQTRAAAVGSRRLSAWAMARHFKKFLLLLHPLMKRGHVIVIKRLIS
jgi:hypothetical protein